MINALAPLLRWDAVMGAHKERAIHDLKLCRDAVCVVRDVGKGQRRAAERAAVVENGSTDRGICDGAASGKTS